MTAQRDPDVILAAWLDEGPTELPGVTRRAIVGALPTTNQARRGPLAPWRFFGMNTPLRLAALAAALVIATAGALYLVGPRFGIGGPGPTPTVAPTPSPSPSPTQSVVELGTVTLTNTGCTWAGNPSTITAAAQPVIGSITLVNETDTFGNFGIYRLVEGRTWEEGQSWIADMNEEFHGGPPASAPVGELTTEVGNVDAPERRAYPNTLVLNSGTHGIVCSSNEPPPGLVFAVYLVGPLEIATE